MDKRQPLSVIIGLASKKLRGGDSPSGDSKDGGPDEMAGDDDSGGKYDDPGLISACEDAIDAMKNRDASALSAAWGHYLDIRESMGDVGDEGGDRN